MHKRARDIRRAVASSTNNLSSADATVLSASTMTITLFLEIRQCTRGLSACKPVLQRSRIFRLDIHSLLFVFLCVTVCNFFFALPLSCLVGRQERCVGERNEQRRLRYVRGVSHQQASLRRGAVWARHEARLTRISRSRAWHSLLYFFLTRIIRWRYLGHLSFTPRLGLF